MLTFATYFSRYPSILYSFALEVLVVEYTKQQPSILYDLSLNSSMHANTDSDNLFSKCTIVQFDLVFSLLNFHLFLPKMLYLLMLQWIHSLQIRFKYLVSPKLLSTARVSVEKGICYSFHRQRHLMRGTYI